MTDDFFRPNCCVTKLMKGIQMAKRNKPRKRTTNRFGFERLEPKRCLASVGWDGAGQGGAELTYYLGDAPAQVGQATFEAVIERALEVWSDVAKITFTETATPGQTDSLDITFANLDGANGVLAQAYFPDDVNRSRLAGDVQFDLAENWEVGNAQGSRAFDLLYVAVHEIGHALGLDHSNASGSVLNSTVSPNQQFTSLANSDRAAILSLYAPATQPTDSVDPATKPVDNPIGPGVSTNDPGVNQNQPEANQPDPKDPSQPDSTNRPRTWNRFHRWTQYRFRFSNQPGNTANPQADLPTVSAGNRYSFRINFNGQFFRIVR